MARIKLSRGKYTLIDDSDLEKVNQHTWHCGKNGYASCNRKEFKVLMHRFILDFPKSNIDHKNGDKLDNRRENLRLCNQSQNTANSSKRKTNTSGFKGVSLEKRNPNLKWVVNLTKDYKHIYGGAFKTKEEAHNRYIELSRKFFGEFAKA